MRWRRFLFRGACRINETDWAPPAAFTGARETLRAHKHSEGHAVLLAMFTPVGAYTFVRSPPMTARWYHRELWKNSWVLPEELPPPNSSNWNAATDHRQRIALVENFLARASQYFGD